MIDKYLTDHTLNKDFVKKLGWNWTEGASSITIPVYDENAQLLFCRYRHLVGENKFSADKGSHPAIYCLHKIKNINKVVLAEGEPDTARLWQENIPAITATSGVKTFNSKLAAPLKGKEVLICLDTDEAGRESIPQYFQVLKEVGAKPSIIELPQSFKDVSEFFSNGGSKDSFEKLPIFDNLEDWLDAHEPETYSWKTAKNILKEELPEEKWLVNKILPIEGFAFFVGPEASGKSYHALSLAKCVVTGEPWLPEKLGKDGQPMFRVMKKTNVLIMDKESTIRRIQDRLRGFELDTDKVSYLAYPHELELTNPEAQKTRESGYTEFIESVARRVKKHNIGFIILDSFVDFFIGDENKPQDTQHFFSAFRQLFSDISILPLHHAGKIQVGLRRPTSQMARGSSNIMAQVYTAFHCEANLKRKGEFTIEQTKAGDSEKMNKFKIESVVIDDPLHKEETLVKEFKYIGEVEDKAEAMSEAITKAQEILEGNGSMFRKDFLEAIVAEGVGQRTAINALKRLESDGLIEMPFSRIPGKTRQKEIVWRGENGGQEGDVFTEE